jgi:hypothetical protein
LIGVILASDIGPEIHDLGADHAPEAPGVPIHDVFG